MVSDTQTSTIFVQADTANFRYLVQQLTGLPGGVDPDQVPSSKLSPRFSPKTSLNRRSSYKLLDRRQALKNKLEIKLGLSGIDIHQQSPRKTTHIGTPRINSPITPMGSELALLWEMNLDSPGASEEEKVIAEKGFYLHPSPANTPREKEPPELLPLFPVTSPRQEIMS